MNKKDLTSAASIAANKFFSNPSEGVTNPTTEITKDDNVTNNTKQTKHTNITNKSKHYDERGKREIRHGLLLDKQLKEDLKMLCYAKGSGSINDYIVSLLIEHTEQPENQNLLKEYSKLKD